MGPGKNKKAFFTTSFAIPQQYNTVLLLQFSAVEFSSHLDLFYPVVHMSLLVPISSSLRVKTGNAVHHSAHMPNNPTIGLNMHVFRL